MKKVCKKLLSLVLVAVLLATAIPFQALAAAPELKYSVTAIVTLDGAEIKRETFTFDAVAEPDVLPVFDNDCLVYLIGGSDLSKYNVGDWNVKGMTGNDLTLQHSAFSNGEQATATISLTTKAVCTHANKKEEIVVAATCTSAGSKKITCADCGADLGTELIAALDHDWGQWTTNPSNTSQEIRTCSVCKSQETRTVNTPTYTVTFVIGTTQQQRIYNQGDTITFTNPGDTNDAYFKYWSEGKNTYTAGTSITCQGSATYTAEYGKKAAYVFKSGKDSGTTTYVYATPGTSVSSPEPAAWSGMTFKGWYTAASGGTQVNFPLTAGAEDSTTTYYAQYYETNKEPNDVYLDVYIKGSLWTRSKRLNLTASSGNYIANDGTISIAENGDVRNLIKSYYTATNSDGIKYDGLYELTGNHPKNYYTDSNKVTTVNGLDEIRANGEKVYFVVLENVKLKSSSSSTADTTNPKTGDSIYMAVTVLGLSVASLAAVYYISKKRAVR